MKRSNVRGTSHQFDSAPMWAILYLTDRLSNEMVNQKMSADQLNRTFAALADPTRRAILARLASGEASVTELAEPFAMSLPAVSKHLKVLERAGLITRGREAQWRPCRLETERLKEVADWVEEYRRLWEQRFDRLDDYLRELQTKGETDDQEHQ
jgi:DNA-binding transcriptional ArsR family regulator